jgi:glutathione synthase/RimK-type ligase-like ATP-grasp enzyme
LWCCDDAFGAARWGHDLCMAARKRGIDARLFTNPAEPDAGYAFFRMYHDPRWLSGHQRDIAVLHANPRLTVIPDRRSALLYDDKVEQARQFGHWMPETRILESREAGEAAVGRLGFPFISKSSGGASSQNVRLIATADAARLEIERVFGAGLPIAKAQVQRGYLLWQRFLAGNPHDYRVVAIGRQRFMFRRHNRPHVPFASGSGRIEAVDNPAGEAAEALAAANDFFAAESFAWCGIDLVRDDRGRWRVLETTVAWMLKNYVHARFIGTDRRVADIWDVLLDEIEAGVLDGRGDDNRKRTAPACR